MKNLFSLILSLLIIGAVYGQDPPETHMYETIYLTPKLETLGKLSDNMAAHNKKYHGPGDHVAFVQNVATGKRSGDLVWVMGPGTFAHLDSRPGEGGHDEDWGNNVVPLLEDMSLIEYWRRDAMQHYLPEDYTAGKIRVRFYKVKTGHNSDFAEHYGKLIQVFKEKKYNRQLAIYWNTFPTGSGRNMASVSSFDSWAEMDQGLPVGKDFAAVHGEGSWEKWLNKLAELTEWTDQEVREINPKMSGTE